LSTVGQINWKLHSIEPGIVTILGSIVALRYSETFSILVLKHWYSLYLSRYQRCRTTLVRI